MFHVSDTGARPYDQLGQKDAQIAALTKMLLEKNPAAGPGAQQAVGAAV